MGGGGPAGPRGGLGQALAGCRTEAVVGRYEIVDINDLSALVFNRTQEWRWIRGLVDCTIQLGYYRPHIRPEIRFPLKASGKDATHILQDTGRRQIGYTDDREAHPDGEHATLQSGRVRCADWSAARSANAPSGGRPARSRTGRSAGGGSFDDDFCNRSPTSSLGGASAVAHRTGRRCRSAWLAHPPDGAMAHRCRHSVATATDVDAGRDR